MNRMQQLTQQRMNRRNDRMIEAMGGCECCMTKGGNVESSVTPDGLRITSSVENIYKQGPENPSHIYLNVTVFNAADDAKRLNIFQTRSTPFLTSPGDYNVTFARFEIPNTAPVSRQGAGLNDNLYVGIGVSGATGTTFFNTKVEYPQRPQHRDLTFSVFEVLNLINLAYEDCVVDANAGITGSVPFGSVIMTYEPESGLYSLNYPEYFVTSNIEISMSYDLYIKFLELQGEYQDLATYVTDPNGVIIDKFRTGTNVLPNSSIQVITPSVIQQGTGDWLQNKQSFPWPSSVNDFIKLIVTSTSLPVVTEYTAFNRTGDLTLDTNNTILPILTDFSIGQFAEGQSTAEPLRYVPNGIYRMTDLMGSKGTAIYTYDLQFQLENFIGDLFPALIPPKKSASLKLLFIKKGLTV